MRSQLVRIITVNSIFEALSNVGITLFINLLNAIALNLLAEVLLLD